MSRKRCNAGKGDIVVTSVTSEIVNGETTVDGRPSVSVRRRPEQAATAEAIAEALDPALVSRLAAQAWAQGVQLLGRTGGSIQPAAPSSRAGLLS